MKTIAADTHAAGVVLAVCLTAMLGACVSVPEPLRGDYSDLPPQVVDDADIGRDVRWGGVILDTHPAEDQTCFEVLSRNLDASMRPREQDRSGGRFIACKAGFYDPEVFARGREVTLTGRVDAIDQRKVGEFDYRYPVVNARFVTLWPDRPDVTIYGGYDPFYDPWYRGPYGWRYPWYWP